MGLVYLVVLGILGILEIIGTLGILGILEILMVLGTLGIRWDSRNTKGSRNTSLPSYTSPTRSSAGATINTLFS